MNFFFQYYDENIDPFNNKYYRLRAYVLEDPVKYKVRELGPHEAQLVKCPKAILEKYFSGRAKNKQNITACFQNPGRIELKSNWW